MKESIISCVYMCVYYVKRVVVRSCQLSTTIITTTKYKTDLTWN